MPSDSRSGPAHKTLDSPPSAASAVVTVPCAQAASSLIERYRFDFPVPFGPVITVTGPNDTTRSHSDRKFLTAMVRSMRAQ
jgi:hypothetical protein